jgi:hypothetical protein
MGDVGLLKRKTNEAMMKRPHLKETVHCFAEPVLLPARESDALSEAGVGMTITSIHLGVIVNRTCLHELQLVLKVPREKNWSKLILM